MQAMIMASINMFRLGMLYLLCFSLHFISSFTDPNDAATLQALKNQWQNTPPNWRTSDDPCGDSWSGVKCNNSTVVELTLSNMGLKGGLGGDIGRLTELRTLDLSFNKGLTGPITSKLGDLQKLNILILAGCGFSGSIPPELGKLSELLFFALNSNNFTGEIPNTLGNLSEVYWLDIADNQISGPIPVSNPDSPGLDLLLKAQHFHFNKNKLSGTIPPELFRSEMVLIHVLFNENQLTGPIPSTLGLVKAIENLRLDRNSLDGEVPSNINNLTSVVELSIAHNQLTGPLPDLTGMQNLNFVDLSSNSFDKSEAPEWFSTLESLTTLIIQNSSLHGPVPQKLFSAPQLQQVILKDNSFDGALDMGNNFSQQLTLVDFANNGISRVIAGSKYNNTLNLTGNPFCGYHTLQNVEHCQKQENKEPYSTIAHCVSKSCPDDQQLSPRCNCAYPYEGTLFFGGPSFRDTSNYSNFHELKDKLQEDLELRQLSISLHNPIFDDSTGYLIVNLQLFPSDGKYFNRSQVQKFGFDLANHTFSPPPQFGPFYFIAEPYTFPDQKGKTSINLGLIIGIACPCTFLILIIAGLAIYAMKQKALAERAVSLRKPFESWGSNGKDVGDAPRLQDSRWFSYDEMKTSTNNFSVHNEIGSGGYGKVYKGILPDGQQIAIKRSQKESKQGGVEFKTEIELLSRLHHRNLVRLLGFCFEQGEHMLVYEYMPNGSLKESLSGKSGIHLDWYRRLCIALGSARGLTYLHDLANPPIIHRDVKTANILLDQNLTAKVADFGLCKLVSDSTESHISTEVKGTMGYLDPEYYMTQQLTEKSDVYSFGVVMLELLTSKQPIEKRVYVVKEAKSMMDKNNEDFCGVREMIDPTLRDSMSQSGFKRFFELAIQCVEDFATDRPTMSQVVKEIELVLQTEGLNASSASSSLTDVRATKAGKKQLYDDITRKDGTDHSNAFDYSGETLLSKVEPK